MDDYRSILTKIERKDLGDAYIVSYTVCLSIIFNQFLLNSDVIQSIATIFDDKKGFKGIAMSFYEQIIDIYEYEGKIPPPIFRNMREILPLQVADIVAYELSKEFQRRLYEPEKKPRWGFERLESSMRKNIPIPFAIGEIDSFIIFRDKTFVQKVANSFRDKGNYKAN